MTPVERVARAICRSDHPGMSERLREFEWMAYIDSARAAIAALREPSEGMIDAAPDVHLSTAIWTAMIDAALSEGSD